MTHKNITFSVINGLYFNVKVNRCLSLNEVENIML